MAREVLPPVPDAWVGHAHLKIGYEIPFNRHFYVDEPPRLRRPNRITRQQPRGRSN